MHSSWSSRTRLDMASDAAASARNHRVAPRPTVSRTEGSEPPNDQLEAQEGTDRATWLLVWTSYSSGRSSNCWLTMTMQQRRTAIEEYDQSRADRQRTVARLSARQNVAVAAVPV
jgi:hypothetical protein